MLDSIIILFSFYGLTFLISNTEGPFGILSYLRNILLINKYFGVYFYKLFSCWFCLGCYSGGIIHFLYFRNFDSYRIILWCLAGGAVSFIFNSIVSNLFKN